MNAITIKVNDQIKTIAEHNLIVQDDKATVIQATNKVNYELLDEATGHAPKHIVTKRVDKDLHISFEEGSEGADLIIEGFYDKADSALIGLAEDGSYYYYIPDSGEIADYVTELEVGGEQGQALGGQSQVTPWWISAAEEGFNALPWLVGLAGVGVLGAALGSGGSSNNNQPAIDNVAPEAPQDLVVSEDGSTVTGTGESGASVEITDPAGNVVGEGVVGEDGTFDVELTTPQLDGEELDVTLTDKAGNTSDGKNVIAPINIVATDDIGSSNLYNEPRITQEEEVRSTTVGLAKIGIGGVVDVSVIDLENSFTFSVDAGSKRDIDVKASGGAVGLDLYSSFDMILFKKDANGNYLEVERADSAVEGGGVIAAVYSGSASFNDIEAGDYLVLLESNVESLGVQVLPGLTLKTTKNENTAYGQGNITGNVIAGDEGLGADKVTENTVVVKIQSNSGDFESKFLTSGVATVKGEYGELTINTDGSYTYVRTTKDPADIGKIDSFTYTIGDDETGKTATANLQIRIDSPDLDIEWSEEGGEIIVEAVADANNAQVDMGAITDEFEDLILEKMTSSKATPGGFITDAIIVEAYKEVRLDVKIGKDGGIRANDEDFTAEVQKLVDGVWITQESYSKTAPRIGDNIMNESYIVPAGAEASEWRVIFGGTETSLGNNPNTVNVTVDQTVTNNDEYVANNVTAVSGNVLENDKSVSEYSGTKLYIKVGVDYVLADGQNVATEHGTFVVQADGSYTYTANVGTITVSEDTLDYKLIGQRGEESNSTVTVKLGANFEGGDNADLVVSTVGNDTYTLGTGADTVIFDNLGGTESGNGNNGLDTWSDFSAVQGDKIDVTGLLDGNQTAANIGDYLTYENGVLMVDRNGNAEFEGLLEVTATDLDELLLLGSIEWEVGTVGIAEFSLDALDGLSSTRSIDTGEGSKAMMMDSETSIGLSDIFENETIEVQSMSTNTEGSAVDGLQGSQQSATDNQVALYDAWQLSNYSSLPNDIGTDTQNII